MIYMEPYDWRHEHSERQAATTNAAQGTTDGESDEHEDKQKYIERDEASRLASERQGKHIRRRLRHEGSMGDTITASAKGKGRRDTLQHAYG